MIQASDPTTLDDYSTEALQIDAEHVPKLQSWIKKHKYRIQADQKKIEMKVGDLFDYTL
jgi:hypothetical protein